MLSDYKSPYGIARHIVQLDTDHWLKVETADGGFRYFYARNWTHFEKDMATEIFEDEFVRILEDAKSQYAAEMARRAANGGKF